MQDNVNKPPHYNWHPKIECLDVCEHFHFHIASALQYLWRYNYKGTPIEDLKKAVFYINRHINYLEKSK